MSMFFLCFVLAFALTASEVKEIDKSEYYIKCRDYECEEAQFICVKYYNIDKCAGPTDPSSFKYGRPVVRSVSLLVGWLAGGCFIRFFCRSFVFRLVDRLVGWLVG